MNSFIALTLLRLISNNKRVILIETLRKTVILVVLQKNLRSEEQNTLYEQSSPLLIQLSHKIWLHPITLR